MPAHPLCTCVVRCGVHVTAPRCAAGQTLTFYADSACTQGYSPHNLASASQGQCVFLSGSGSTVSIEVRLPHTYWPCACATNSAALVARCSLAYAHVCRCVCRCKQVHGQPEQRRVRGVECKHRHQERLTFPCPHTASSSSCSTGPHNQRFRQLQQTILPHRPQAPSPAASTRAACAAGLARRTRRYPSARAHT